MYENFTLNELKEGIESAKKGFYYSLAAFILAAGVCITTGSSNNLESKNLKIKYQANELNKFSSMGLSILGITTLFYDSKRKTLQEVLEDGI